MADNLPEPKSRKESYLAKAAGMSVTIPEVPESRTEQYLAAIAEGGGGGGGTTYTAGANIQISADNVISATDTTYSAFTGATSSVAGSAGLVPAPTTADTAKFLKGDGTWDTAGGGGPTVVQTTGQSTTDVMSQKATTDMVFDPDDSDYSKTIRIIGGSGGNGVYIGKSAAKAYRGGVRIGFAQSNSATSNNVCFVGNQYQTASSSTASGSVGVGQGFTVQNQYAVCLGAYSKATEKGQMDISTSASNGTLTYGYNDTQYRLLTGLYDGQSAHDAATYGQMNTRLGGLTLLTISQTDYDNLGTKDPNTLYVITGA